MSTYGELATEVLGMLDQPLDTTGDVLTQVQNKLHRVNQSLLVQLRPPSMLTEASCLNVTSSATYINLGVTSPGFSVTNLAKLFSLSVDDGTSSTRNDYEWVQKEWTTWKRIKNVMDGDQRSGELWTYDPVNSKFYLSRFPTGSETWDLYLHYYKTVAVYADATVPEIPEEHHSVLVYGTALEFPHFFDGDRSALVGVISRKYADAYQALFSDQMIANKTMVQSAAIGVKRSRQVLWAR